MRTKAWVAGLLAILTTSTLADGGLVAPAELSEDFANITYQSAVLIHRDGIERLIVRNTIEGQPGTYSWVLPIPSEPIDLKEPNADDLEDLRHELQPKVESYEKFDFKRGITFAGLVLVFVLMAPRRLRDEGSDSLVLFLKQLGLFAGVLLLLHLFWRDTGGDFASAGKAPTAGGSSSSSNQTEVLRSETVGGFDVTVVRGKTSENLLAWLKDNGTPLPDRANSVVDDYIREGWCFVTAKVRSASEGEIDTNGIEVSFKSAGPVYPMRLTALADTSVELDLIVLGEGIVHQPNLDTWATKATLRHSEPSAYSWPGASMTRMHGTVGTADMSEDFKFEWKPFRYIRKRVLSPVAAGRMSVLVFGWSLAILATLAVGYRLGVGYDRVAGPALVTAALFGGLKTLGWFSLQTVVPANEESPTAHKD